MADHGIALFEELRLLGNGRLTGRASATASRLSKASGEILQHDPGAMEMDIRDRRIPSFTTLLLRLNPFAVLSPLLGVLLLIAIG
jgi:hypothetical protein